MNVHQKSVTNYSQNIPERLLNISTKNDNVENAATTTPTSLLKSIKTSNIQKSEQVNVESKCAAFLNIYEILCGDEYSVLFVHCICVSVSGSLTYDEYTFLIV